MKRPTGITVLGILAIIGGALVILAGFLGLMAGAVATGSGAAGLSSATAKATGSLFFVSIVAIVLGVLDLVLGVGFLQLRSWAWPLGIGLQIAGIVLDVVYIATNNSTITNEILPIAISGVILYYLFRPNVKQVFGRA